MTRTSWALLAGLAVAMAFAVGLWLLGLALAVGAFAPAGPRESVVLVGAPTTAEVPTQPSADAAPTSRATARPSARATAARARTGTAAPSTSPGAGDDPDGPAALAGATPTLRPAVDWPELPDLSANPPITTTAHFAVHAADPEDALLTDLAEAWTPRLEPILDYVSARLGRDLPRTPVHLVFTRSYDAACPARGLASPGLELPLLLVYVDERTTATQIRAVLAHEMVHHLTSDSRFVGDGILTEGIAHWGSGEMLLAWQRLGDWEEAVREYRADGSYVSIADDTALNPRPGEDCIERRDRVYNIRTAFVDWLVRAIGLETVLAMPYHERRTTDPESGEEQVERWPDYEAATGSSLAELEQLWLADLEREEDGNAW